MREYIENTQKENAVFWSYPQIDSSGLQNTNTDLVALRFHLSVWTCGMNKGYCKACEGIGAMDLYQSLVCNSTGDGP